MNPTPVSAGTARWLLLWRRLRSLGAREPALVAATVAALALYYLIPSPLLSLPPLLAYALLAWLRLDIALTTLPLTFPYWFVPKRVGGHAVLLLSEIALGICLAVALGHELRDARRASARHALRRMGRRLRGVLARVGWPLVTGILLVVAGATLGLLVARRPAEALRAWRWEIAEPLVYLSLVLLYARGPRNAWRLLWALLASAALLALLAIVQITLWRVTFTPLAQGNHLVPLRADNAGLLRATAFVYGSGNSLGAALERALPLVLAVALVGIPLHAYPRARGRVQNEGRLRLARGSVQHDSSLMRDGQESVPSRGGQTWGVRLLAAMLCLALLPALFWSASRGAWVGAAVGALVVVCVAVGRPWLLAVLAALGGALALWQRDQIFALALTGHNATGQLRLLIWLAAWHMIRDHPLLGIGLDQFLYLYSNLYTNHPYWITTLNGQRTIVWTQPDLSHPHNLVLDLWLSVGLLGLLGFALVLAVVWHRCWHLWRAALASPASSSACLAGVVALGAGASVLAGFVHGMVDSAYFEPDLALMFWASIALVLLVSRGGMSKSAELAR